MNSSSLKGAFISKRHYFALYPMPESEADVKALRRLLRKVIVFPAIENIMQFLLVFWHTINMRGSSFDRVLGDAASG